MKNIVLKFTRWLAPLAVVVATFAAFVPALQSGFVDLDDDANFLNNPNYRGLGWNQIRWMFTTFHMGHYQPLSWMTLGGDYLFWGMNASGYHLTNVVLHGVNALIFYFVCLRLLRLSIAGAKDLPCRAAAAVAALLFAIHPLRVESVAWITERRDVLSATFFLLTIVAYLNAATAETRSERFKWLCASVAVYALSLLSKATGMTLPVVLLLLDIYALKRLGGPETWLARDVRSIWVEKVPFVVLAAVAAVVAALAQQSIGAMVSLTRYSVAERAAQAFYGLVFYLWRTIVPSGLAPLYEVPRDFSPWEPTYAAAAALVLGVSAALFFLRDRWAPVWAVWLYYIVMVLPVSGIAQSGSQLVADRYSYLSCLGWAVLAGAALYLLWSRERWSRTVASVAAAAAICVSLGFLTWRQAQIWHDSDTLLTYALAHDPNSRIAQNNFGNLLYQRGKVDEAVARFRKAIDSNPYYDYPYANLAVALAAQGKTDEAIAMYRKALDLNPRFTTARVRLAELLVRTGQNDAALDEFRKAVELEPSSSEAHHRWGNALMRAGDWDAAAEQYRAALKTDPKNVELRTNLGGALAGINQDSAAIAEYRAALEVDPKYISARYNLGLLLAENGDVPGAIQNLRRVVDLSPDDAEAHYHLGRLLAEQGERRSAAEELQQALKLRPQWPEAEERLKALARGPAQ